MTDRLKAETVFSVSYFLSLIEVMSLRKRVMTFGHCCVNSVDFG